METRVSVLCHSVASYLLIYAQNYFPLAGEKWRKKVKEKRKKGKKGREEKPFSDLKQRPGSAVIIYEGRCPTRFPKKMTDFPYFFFNVSENLVGFCQLGRTFF